MKYNVFVVVLVCDMNSKKALASLARNACAHLGRHNTRKEHDEHTEAHRTLLFQNPMTLYTSEISIAWVRVLVHVHGDDEM